MPPNFAAASNSSASNSRGKEDMEDTMVCQIYPYFLQIISRHKYDAWIKCINKYHQKHEAHVTYMEYVSTLLFQSNTVDNDEVTLLPQELRSCLATAASDRNQSSTMEKVWDHSL
jgi:hypothetical protein